jgi:hypothetical protein
LRCYENQLTSLNISGCIKLGTDTNSDTYSVSISSNKLSATALNEIFTALPTVTNNQEIEITDNPGTSTCNKSIATNKGWRVIDTN